MTGKDFLNSVANGEVDVVALLLGILEETGAEYCLIGGLAVNAYVEPVVSLDLDLAVAANRLDAVCDAASEAGLEVERFAPSVNLRSPKSDLRVQLQTDPRYQDFIARSGFRDVLGYRMRVAAIEDVLQGKTWAWMDDTRRRSKRQKDLADILRIVEARPDLEAQLPEAVREAIE